MGYGDEVDIGMCGSRLTHSEKGLFSDCGRQASVIIMKGSLFLRTMVIVFFGSFISLSLSLILFYLQGHPQCLKKAMIVGLPVDLGSLRRSWTGASLPVCGGMETSTFGGVSQDDNSCMVVILSLYDVRYDMKWTFGVVTWNG